MDSESAYWSRIEKEVFELIRRRRLFSHASVKRWVDEHCEWPKREYVRTHKNKIEDYCLQAKRHFYGDRSTHDECKMINYI